MNIDVAGRVFKETSQDAISVSLDGDKARMAKQR